MSKTRRTLRAISAFAAAATLALGAYWLLTDPRSPFPDRYNPLLPLDLAQAQSPLTEFKLRRALRSPESCLAALTTGAAFDAMPPLEVTPQCGIENRVRLRAVGEVLIEPVETACETALRLAALERFALRDAAPQPIARLQHQGSYNCRPIRGGTRMSTHATAQAIDLRGVILADGTSWPLLGNWEGDSPAATFWRAARDGGCKWFSTVLGPEFNAAHADHLHLQSAGWGTCR